MWYDALSTWRACAKAWYGYSGAAAASRLNVGGNGAHEFVHRGITICAGQLSRNDTPPAVPGRVKGLSPSVPGEARWGIQYQKDAARSGEPRLREAGKVMQGRENSAPPERLAGQYAFPKLTQASGFAGGPTARPGAQGKMSVSPVSYTHLTLPTT